MRSVAVCGSCISRDNFNSDFNPGYRTWYRVDLSANQSSMIALMSPPVEPEVEDSDGLSPYDAWNVRSDMSREFLTDLVRVQPDFLVLDFFGDVHFGVIRLADGRYLTDNRWKLWKTAYHRRLLAAGTSTRMDWRTDADGYRALWTDAMDRFAAFVAEHCPDTHVIVHRGAYVDRVVTGKGRPRNLRAWAGLPATDVRRTNNFWASLDEHAITAYGWDAIDLRAERYTSYAEHPWGASWVHYTQDYDHRFLAELHQRDLQRRLDPDQRDRVALIAEASRERVRNQAEFIRSVDRAQRRRIAELEKLGVLAAGRAALGRARAARRTKAGAR